MAKSNTSTGIVPPITIYADSKEAQDLAPQYVKLIPSTAISGNINSLDLDDEEVPLVEVKPPDEVESPEGPKDEEEVVVKKAPLLSDVELVSKTVSYDASGIPSVTAIFKIRNSSGQIVKSVNARVQI
jgi:hypothetical protein